MKKTYLIPEIEILKLEIHQVLSSTSNPDVTPDPEAEPVNPNTFEAPSWFGGDGEDW